MDAYLLNDVINHCQKLFNIMYNNSNKYEYNEIL